MRQHLGEVYLPGLAYFELGRGSTTGFVVTL